VNDPKLAVLILQHNARVASIITKVLLQPRPAKQVESRVIDPADALLRELETFEEPERFNFEDQ
jgi:hypothetical protein